METRKTSLTILIVYFIIIAVILWLGYIGKINFWLTPLQTIPGLIVFVIIFILTQLIFSLKSIKSKLLTLIFFNIILFILIFCLFVNIAEWANLSEDIFEYISLILSLFISLSLGFLYYKKNKDIETDEFKNRISLHTLLISSGFALVFLISYLLAKKLESSFDHILGLFGIGMIISLFIGIAIFLWTLGSFLMVRCFKK